MDDGKRQTILAPGAMLGCYQIESFLGQGGFGVTYIARDTMLHCQVAIKEYLPEKVAERGESNTVFPSNPDNTSLFRTGLANFLKEARTLARFKHPNIVRVMSVFELNGTAYMVMEYERGHVLKVLFNRRLHVTEEALKGIVGPIMDGLDEVHRHGFIHRDIKPANVLVRDNGTPVLLDFGSARLTVGNAAEALTALVTVGFAPLEQYSDMDDQQGPWTDIYALGAVMYCAITGQAPLDSTLRGAAVLNDNPDPMVPLLRIAPEGFSPSFCRAVDWALQFKVSDRPQSIQQWRAELFGDEPLNIMALEPKPLEQPLSLKRTKREVDTKADTQLLAMDEPTVIHTASVSELSEHSHDDTYEISESDTQGLRDNWDMDDANQFQRQRVGDRSKWPYLVPALVLLGIVALIIFKPRSSPSTETFAGSTSVNDALVADRVAAAGLELSIDDSIADIDGPTLIKRTPLQREPDSAATGSNGDEPMTSTAEEATTAQPEANRVPVQNADQLEVDRKVQRAEARRQSQLLEQRAAAAVAAAERKGAARRAAENEARIAREAARELAVARAASERAAEAENERVKVKPAITDADMSSVLRRFDELSSALENRDGEALRLVTINSIRKNAYFDYVFRTFEKIEVDVRNIRASRQDQTVRATLTVRRMIRANGDIAIPPEEFKNMSIYSVKESQWSAIHW